MESAASKTDDRSEAIGLAAASGKMTDLPPAEKAIAEAVRRKVEKLRQKGYAARDAARNIRRWVAEAVARS